MSALFGRHIYGTALQIARQPPCPQCGLARYFSKTTQLAAGHNKWSKIKHDKGRADSKVSQQRAAFAKNLTLFSRLHGSDPAFNPALSNAILAARKGGMPKASIDAAVARGQGRSDTGAKLEHAQLEVMFGGGAVAIVIDIETDNKNRSLKDLKFIVKGHAGTVAPTAFLFSRRGRTVLKLAAGMMDGDEVLMETLEAGAEDVEIDDGDGETHVVVWTQPADTHETGQRVSEALKAEIVESEIIYTPNADRVAVDAETAQALGEFLNAVQEYGDVQAIYANIEQGDLANELWAPIEECIDS